MLPEKRRSVNSRDFAGILRREHLIKYQLIASFELRRRARQKDHVTVHPSGAGRWRFKYVAVKRSLATFSKGTAVSTYLVNFQLAIRHSVTL
jgi:hypothetical protein